jgi:hypothetical protein
MCQLTKSPDVLDPVGADGFNGCCHRHDYSVPGGESISLERSATPELSGCCRRSSRANRESLAHPVADTLS